MRNILSFLCMIAALALQPGCKTAPTATELTRIQLVTREVAATGVAYDLEENPLHRAKFVLCQQALGAMVAANDFSPAALAEAVKGIPALTGASGALFEGGLTLYMLALGWVDIDSAPRVKAVVVGLQAGIAEALARPTGTATRALAPPLPRQCTVPPR